jgi:hypothetical protein
MTQQDQDPTVLSIFAGFPVYIFNYLFGLLLAVFSDITLTSLAIGSFCLGRATTLWVGLALFFLGHTGIKIVNALNGAIVQQGRMVAQSGRLLASVFTAQAEAAPKPDLDPVQDTPAGS